MQSSSLLKAGVLTIILVIGFVAAWEFHLRNKGITIAYDDGGPLWSDKRKMVYEDPGTATVFIGSSRNKYDIDIPTWESITGDHAIQLAIEGNSPLPVLDDLAADAKFHGKLVIDVTEGLFFSTSPRNTSEPQERITYFKKQTPAQRFSFYINHALESQFVFLDKEYLSLNPMLEQLPLPKREGVHVLPYDCPMEFGQVSFERQNKMTSKFLSDTTLQNHVKGLWDFYRKSSTEPPVSGVKLDSILSTVKIDIDKIRSRGGQVIFVRTPSSGPYWAGEQKAFPRDKYWNRLLSVTNVTGIHFNDYPEINHFQCPEFSHLKPSDAIIFTRNLVPILEQKGWLFSHSTKS